MNAKGGNISGEDVAQLMYNVCQAAINTLAEQAAQAAALKKAKQSFRDWFLSGGKKALKTLLSIPSKIAKGGALASRAYNLVTPESIMEYYVVAVGIPDQPDAGVPSTRKKFTMSYQLQNSPHPFTDIGCYGGCGDMSTPLANATGVLNIIGVNASFTSSYTLQDEALDTVTCTVTGSGTWQDSPSTALSLSGTFSCTAPTHKETGTFTSSSDWMSMSAGYLQPLTTPVWKATFQSQGSECASTCAGDVKFKPLRLTPQ
jgi:hypothetical protein